MMRFPTYGKKKKNMFQGFQTTDQKTCQVDVNKISTEDYIKTMITKNKSCHGCTKEELNFKPRIMSDSESCEKWT